MINYSVRILSSNKRLVKLIKLHIIEFAANDIIKIS
jgi:hypothetical protein